MIKSYGIQSSEQRDSEVDRHLEELKRLGYSYCRGAFNQDECEQFITRINRVYQQQLAAFGEEQLAKINELNMVRMPFIEDPTLVQLFDHQRVQAVVEESIGKVFHIHLQNAILNAPAREHHQSSWHRDLPYQEWRISKSIAVNAFVMLTEFTAENGATYLIPGSHLFETFPSQEFAEEHKVQLIGRPGDVVFFDSMCYHRAGSNSSENVRIGVNNMFVVPILKQQINVAKAIGDRINEYPEELHQLLGITYDTPEGVNEFRKRRIEKL